ncbi:MULTISPECIES: FMN-dependent NADH-azoreductase [unclassified Fusibacter]|uniref:FMN-dependent NADH-azoreductase n=1 Tax=unclassified Fusibacter TaxID=2624464 RepID=UPI0010120806|nr:MULTISPECIES: FMN-dependent NADH-azoreductase [unclassified Fusibacter]MCK8058040.1 FMN-dependent NADH-azoreductase [Fusibacter sp. A2]NPE20622.1 FMN-dependent NADH-azoreductase [Fusibacter sp. A1]RXV62829.1 FMN-dependent NADH-azoreductase [Fusibacter sp. A1]
MKKVLFIKANPKASAHSFSLDASENFIKTYQEINPTDEVVELDLYKLDIPFIDEDVFNGWGKLGEGVDFSDLTDQEQYKVGTINQFTEQFMGADKYVFATPLWNFSLPPKMKVYIDTLMVAGKTFKYTAEGPVGLLNNKKALHVHASGGIYSEGPAKAMEHGDSYLKTVLGFMGVMDIESVLLEGTNMATDGGASIKTDAAEKLEQLVKSF